MGGGVHFSLDQLPERYRAQVVRGALCGRVTSPSSVRPRTDNGQGVKDAGKDAAANGGKDGGQGKKGGEPRAPVNLPRSASSSPNKTEERFNRELLHGRGKYEAMTLRLPSGVKYTPDFVFEDGGRVCLAEVKGGYRLPTHGRSVMAFKIACSEFPMFRFVFAELTRDGKAWKVGVYEGGLLVRSAEGTASQVMGTFGEG